MTINQLKLIEYLSERMTYMKDNPVDEIRLRAILIHWLSILDRIKEDRG